MNTLLLRLALGGLIAIAGPAAANGLTTLRLLPAGNDGQLQVEASGDWAPACAPQPRNAWVEQQTVYFEVREASQACKGQATQTVLLRSAPLALPADATAGGRVLRLQLVGADSGRVLAFALAGDADGDTPLLPESGLWWPERGGEYETSGPGFGVQIEVQERMLAVNVSGYADSGQPTWWFGAAPLGSRQLALELSALSGGSGPFAEFATPKSVALGGRLFIEWLGPARAVFWFVRPQEQGDGIELRPVSMTRFSFATRPGESWRGQWLLLTTAPGGESRAEVQRFEWVGGDDLAFELQSDRGLRLSCARAEQRSDSPPERCRLADPDEGWQLEFRDIGLSRLDTRVDDGTEVSLRRL